MPLLPERRTHPRYPTGKIVSCSHRDKRFLTLTLNLGLGGMKIKTHYHLPQGAVLDFNLILRDFSVDLKGRTLYSQGGLPRKQKASGIEFMDLSEQNRNMSHDYLINLERWPKKRGMRFPSEETATRENIRSAVGKGKIK
jgi:hypothetical protein